MRALLFALLLTVAGSALPNDPDTSTSTADFIAIVANTEAVNPFAEDQPTAQAFTAKCCRVCKKGKPCGDTCIAQDNICHVGPGCAC
jgi:hypothetical protein